MNATTALDSFLAKHRLRVSDCEALILLALAERHRCRASQLRKRLNLHQNTVGSGLHRLRSRGEVGRQRAPKGSAVWYSLTAEGHRIVKQLMSDGN